MKPIKTAIAILMMVLVFSCKKEEQPQPNPAPAATNVPVRVRVEALSHSNPSYDKIVGYASDGTTILEGDTSTSTMLYSYYFHNWVAGSDTVTFPAGVCVVKNFLGNPWVIDTTFNLNTFESRYYVRQDSSVHLWQNIYQNQNRLTFSASFNDNTALPCFGFANPGSHQDSIRFQIWTNNILRTDTVILYEYPECGPNPVNIQ